ncbi:methionyl-tRNA formyltransferase [Lysinibacillus sp. SGAir0095]|uniref:methionyl-tRNA formyltransferase n=1 Tax=Lysinibacillus sp. SGAir0095 TaxID=2070463 RepID=UPI0010CD40E8|nr:formyltransferase family protein [Lysinibacillus sp. SGAir0095]QCR31974.1 methionyl-tRNA formyltransferase [Lysinibacillus sp. SGAir0095]
MIESNLKVVFITMGVTNVFTSLLEAGIQIIGVIESRSKNATNRSLSLQSFCQESSIPYYYMDNGCDELLESWVRELEPDLIVINSMSELLKKNILDIPNKGCINLHPTLLPKYRGGYPFFWTFYDMDLNPGITVHYIDEGEDTGDIIYQESYPIPLGCTEEQLIDILETQNGVRLLLQAITDIEKDSAPRIKQTKDSPTVRARKISPNEFPTIIDWEKWEIERIWHLLRGTQNWLDVFDFTEIPQYVSKWRIQDYTKEEFSTPVEFGKVYSKDDEYLVYCGQGKITMELIFE